MIPFISGSLQSPTIVNVLPAPVCPQAKIVPLQPSRAFYMMLQAQSSQIYSCLDQIPKTQSKINSLISLSFLMLRTFSLFYTQIGEFKSLYLLLRGRIRIPTLTLSFLFILNLVYPTKSQLYYMIHQIRFNLMLQFQYKLRTIIMNNRWGRQLDPKGTLKTSGQNNINININFNAVKDKPNAFGGKKIDNFIEISNQPKSAISRPNVSMETLKQKKKKSINRQDKLMEQELQRKRSKSKIINDILTPEKAHKDWHVDNSKSVGKKSTKKRSAKSFDNLKKFFGKSPPKEDRSKDNQISQSGENSREKSRSRSKSGKKLVKNSSKAKLKSQTQIQGAATSKKIKSSNHNTRKQPEEQKNGTQKWKKQNLKNERQVETLLEKNEGSVAQQLYPKPPREAAVGKKPTQNEGKRVGKIKTPNKKSIDKEARPLKRLPLFYQEDEEPYEEQKVYRKMDRQAHKVLYEDSVNRFKKDKKEKEQIRESSFLRYLRKVHTNDDLRCLNTSATEIQRIWRGYKARSQFINELNMMNHKIQMTKNKIANLDPKFWDDAQSNSILKADDAYSIKSSSAISDLHSEIGNPNSQNSTSKNRLRKSRGTESADERHQMLERITRLQQNVKKFQAMNQQLSSENKQLKVNLQKVSAQSALNSGSQSMEESLKSEHSWEVAFKQPMLKQEADPFLQQEEQAKHFNIKMPTKIENIGPKAPKRKQTQNVAHLAEEANSIQKYKGKIQNYECSSPKYSVKMRISPDVLELFQKKEDQLKQSFQKKVSIFDRMLSDSIFSPRTYTLKKNQLQEKFRHETELIKTKKQEVTRVAQYIKEIEEERPKPTQSIQPKNQIKNDSLAFRQGGHVIEDYGNLNLNSHRSKSESQECEQFESSLDSDTKETTFKKSPLEIEGLPVSQIQQKNSEVIRIFQQVSEHEQKSHQVRNGDYLNQGCISEKSKEPELSNNSQVSGEPKKQTKGFETALLFIKEYCVQFVEFIRNSENHKISFVENICSPVTYDSFQFLKAYRTTTAYENECGYNSQEKEYIYPYFKLISPKCQAISREAFVDFNESYEKLQGECLCKTDREFFLNSLFDAFNESLDYKRPCSIYGKPPAWICEYKRLKNHYLAQQDGQQKQNFLLSQKFDEICGLAIARVIQWSTSLCGFIPESPQMENLVIEEEQINHIRQTRIALMLEKDLLENEEHMLDSTIEQTEVKLQTAEAIAHGLISELAQELQLLFK